MAGETKSANFPKKKAVDKVLVGQEAFVAKILPSGTALSYSTYLGGSGDQDIAQGIAVDDSGAAYITGWTDSPDFPVANAFDATLDKGQGSDAFVSKLGPTGKDLVYSTYLGGGSLDAGFDIAVDDQGQAFVTGYTNSGNFPFKMPWDNKLSGYQDAFVTKLASSGKFLMFSTLLGGQDYESGLNIALSETGEAYVTGWTTSGNFPVKNAFDKSYNGGGDAFILKIKFK